MLAGIFVFIVVEMMAGQDTASPNNNNNNDIKEGTEITKKEVSHSNNKNTEEIGYLVLTQSIPNT